MNKEELINLINSLTIEEINAFKIQYYSEKKDNYRYSQDEREEKEILFGCDFSQLYMQKFDRLNDKMRDLQNQVYEMGRTNE